MSERLTLSDRARFRELERENRELRMEKEFLKKRQPSSRGTTVSAKYALIDAEKADQETKIITSGDEPVAGLSVAKMCSWKSAL